MTSIMCNVLARFCLPFKKTNPTTTHNDEFNGIIQNSSEKENKYKITPVLCIKYDPSSVKEKIGEGGSSVVFHYNTGKTSYACKKIKTSAGISHKKIIPGVSISLYFFYFYHSISIFYLFLSSWNYFSIFSFRERKRS